MLRMPKKNRSDPNIRVLRMVSPSLLCQDMQKGVRLCTPWFVYGVAQPVADPIDIFPLVMVTV